MKRNIASKTIILYVLELVKKGSGKNYPISYTSIANVLNSIGVKCERRTVSRNVQYLIDFGEPIIKVEGRGCYYNHDGKREVKIFQEEQ